MRGLRLGDDQSEATILQPRPLKINYLLPTARIDISTFVTIIAWMLFSEYIEEEETADDYWLWTSTIEISLEGD
jgi:hypothetical protein